MRSIKSLSFLSASALVALVASQALVACSSSTTSTSDGGTDTDAGADAPSTTCDAAGSGTLTIDITGLPAGVDAKVKVTGPGGAQDVTAAGPLTVGGGSYTVTAERVIAPDPTVRTVYDATVSSAPVCVKDGEGATLTVTYSAIPTSNKLWTGNGNGTHDFLAFSSASLQASGSPPADLGDDMDRPSGVAFDQDGGLWLARAGEVDYFKAATLATSGQKTADIALTSTAFSEGVPGVHGVALDKSGNLWVTAPAAGKVLRIDAAATHASGAPEPSVVLSGIQGPIGLAFDSTGNLWVAESTSSHVLEYAAARLSSSSADPADRSITAETPAPSVTTLGAPGALAFDKSDNLWVVYNGGLLGRLTTAERSATGVSTVTPAVQVALDVTSLAEGIAFDEGGGLWLGYQAGKLAHIAPADLAASGQPTPDRILTSSDVKDAGEIAIFPAPAGTPLYSALP